MALALQLQHDTPHTNGSGQGKREGEVEVEGVGSGRARQGGQRRGERGRRGAANVPRTLHSGLTTQHTHGRDGETHQCGAQFPCGHRLQGCLLHNKPEGQTTYTCTGHKYQSKSLPQMPTPPSTYGFPELPELKQKIQCLLG
jgi:hypothetical protein